MINIDGSSDPFYTYKMPKMPKIEVKHNRNNTTSFPNLDDVAKSLGRPPAQLLVWLGYAFSTNTKGKELGGHHYSGIPSTIR